MDELPDWQSARKHDRIRAMMKDQKALLERETMGIMQDAAEKAFSGRSINRFFELPAYTFESTVNHIFVAVDPNAGGKSRFAIVSCAYKDGKIVIIGLEAIQTHRPSDYENILIEHLRLLRRHSRYCSLATLVLMPEANLGFEAHYIERSVMRSKMARCCVTMRDDDTPGLRTTHKVKEAMYVKTKDALNDDRIVFADSIVTANPETTAEELKSELKDEMQTYSVVVEHPQSVFADSKKTFTGKIGGFQDDLIVCLQLNVLWHGDFFLDRKYASYW